MYPLTSTYQSTFRRNNVRGCGGCGGKCRYKWKSLIRLQSDDIVLIADSLEDLQKILNKIVKVIENIELNLNAR
jgi:PII-like signaling protein